MMSVNTDVWTCYLVRVFTVTIVIKVFVVKIEQISKIAVLFDIHVAVEYTHS